MTMSQAALSGNPGEVNQCLVISFRPQPVLYLKSVEVLLHACSHTIRMAKIGIAQEMRGRNKTLLV